MHSKINFEGRVGDWVQWWSAWPTSHFSELSTEEVFWKKKNVFSSTELTEYEFVFILMGCVLVQVSKVSYVLSVGEHITLKCIKKKFSSITQFSLRQWHRGMCQHNFNLFKILNLCSSTRSESQPWCTVLMSLILSILVHSLVYGHAITHNVKNLPEERISRLWGS